MELDEDVTIRLVNAAEQLMKNVDQDLLARLGDCVTQWTADRDQWRLEEAVATLIDSVAYLVVQYTDPPSARRSLMAVSAAGLSITGAQFINAKADEERREAMN